MQIFLKVFHGIITKELKSQPASAIVFAKLHKEFEKLPYRRREFQFFPWSLVDFVLYHSNFLVRYSAYVRSFWNVLPYELVRVLNASFLP